MMKELCYRNDPIGGITEIFTNSIRFPKILVIWLFSYKWTSWSRKLNLVKFINVYFGDKFQLIDPTIAPIYTIRFFFIFCIFKQEVRKPKSIMIFIFTDSLAKYSISRSFLKSFFGRIGVMRRRDLRISKSYSRRKTYQVSQHK